MAWEAYEIEAENFPRTMVRFDFAFDNEKQIKISNLQKCEAPKKPARLYACHAQSVLAFIKPQMFAN